MREMKYSGVPWIGNIPSEWSVCKFSSIIKSDNGGEVIDKSFWGNGEELLYTCKKEPILSDFPSFPKWKRTSVGDLLLTRNASPYIFTPQNDAIYSNVVQRVVLKDGYFYKFIRFAVLEGAHREVVNGDTIPSYNMQVWRNIRIPNISYDLQKTIALFLENKCILIDNILKNTRQSIEEYKKWKQFVITNAITKGIRNGRTYKDSGSIWFKDIPVEWEMSKLKFIFTIRKRIIGEDGHTVLAITQNGIKPKDMSNGTGQFAESYANYQIVHPGDFAMNHMDLLTGWVDVSKYEGVTSPDYRVFTLDNSNHCPSYYLYMMQMCYFNRIFYSMGQGVSGMGRWRLPSDMFNNFLVCIPPYKEQFEIAEYLDDKCSEINSLIDSKLKIIKELESYKRALIYEYITGKKEVE